ncbi:MAG: glycosyl transferase family 1 [Betaproteobacteria bacterium RIFCSPLOWO2_12_FULL_62_13]|nr:MAG: glycosyl transferase family 1 [Betaproteobacteria bacterium RIFCSPLOWO2_12_FULL_62_13]
MNLLFVHQNFPGQFKHLAPHFAQAGHRVRSLAIDGPGIPGIETQRYKPNRGSSRQIHPWAAEFETKVIRGEACAAAASQLKAQGFTPDVIIANPGWGESLFLKDVWPEARLFALIEFYYAARGLDFDFDAEFFRQDLARDAKLRAKNAHMLLTLEAMDWGLSPTHFQKSTVPKSYHDRISVIFDGIDTKTVQPERAAMVTLNGRIIRAGEEVVTFVNRNLEPYRGYHIFMRALPEILRRRPNAVALIVGGDGVSYGAPPPAGKTWKQIFLDEVKDRLDSKRVFFLGRLPYADYLKVLQVSACHAYLTYPFVLGWSCIEAMSSGCLVIGSRTSPVEEVIEHQEDGLLVDFFDVDALANTVIDCLARPAQYAPLRAAARRTAVERYDLATICLPEQVRLIEEVSRKR